MSYLSAEPTPAAAFEGAAAAALSGTTSRAGTPSPSIDSYGDPAPYVPIATAIHDQKKAQLSGFGAGISKPRAVTPPVPALPGSFFNARPSPFDASRASDSFGALPVGKENIGSFLLSSDLNGLCDVKWFGLEGPHLQQTMTAMLKAVASLSEDFKIVRSQFDVMQAHDRETHTGVWAALERLNERLDGDYVEKKRWGEARYEDQRRTDKVNAAFNEFREVQLADLGTLLPRVGVLESSAMAVQTELAVQATKFAAADEVHATFAKHERQLLALAEAGERNAEATRRASAEALEEQGKATDRLRRHIDASIANVELLQGELESVARATARHTADAAAALEQAAADRAKAEEDLGLVQQGLAASMADVTKTANDVQDLVASGQNDDSRRLTNVENQMDYKWSSLDVEMKEAQLRIKSVFSDTELIKSETAAVHVTVAELDAKNERWMNGKLAAVDDLVAVARKEGDAMKRAQQLHSREAESLSEKLQADFEAFTEDVGRRVKAIDKRRKGEEAVFRDEILAEVGDRCEGDVAQHLSGLRAKFDGMVENVAAAGRVLGDVADVRDTLREWQPTVEARIKAVSDRTDVSAVAAATSAIHQELSMLFELLAIDVGAAQYIMGDVERGSSEAAAGRTRRDRFNRFVRSLPWFPATKVSPGTPAGAPFDGVGAPFVVAAAAATDHTSRHVSPSNVVVAALMGSSPAPRSVGFVTPTAVAPRSHSDVVGSQRHVSAAASAPAVPRPRQASGSPGRAALRSPKRLTAAHSSPDALAPSSANVSHATPDTSAAALHTSASGAAAAPAAPRVGVEINDTIDRRGVVVVSCGAGGPAAAAGLAAGDLVHSFNGRVIRTKTDFVNALVWCAPHAAVPLQYYASGNPNNGKTTTMTLGGM
jgi:hypothetical protein